MKSAFWPQKHHAEEYIPIPDTLHETRDTARIHETAHSLLDTLQNDPRKIQSFLRELEHVSSNTLKNPPQYREFIDHLFLSHQRSLDTLTGHERLRRSLQFSNFLTRFSLQFANIHQNQEFKSEILARKTAFDAETEKIYIQTRDALTHTAWQ